MDLSGDSRKMLSEAGRQADRLCETLETHQREISGWPSATADDLAAATGVLEALDTLRRKLKTADDMEEGDA